MGSRTLVSCDNRNFAEGAIGLDTAQAGASRRSLSAVTLP
ncbi:hypothetical protein SFIMM107S_02098 [Streptomyces griseus]